MFASSSRMSFLCLKSAKQTINIERAFRISSVDFLWGKKNQPPSSDEKSDNPIDRIKKINVIHKDVIIASKQFERVNKDKESYISLIDSFKKEGRAVQRQGQVEFIYGALRCLRDFNLHKDLEVYKALMDVFPKDRMVVRNFFQEAGTYYPKQQFCALALLEEMEYNNVIPDKAMEDLVISIFGKRSRVWQKIARQVYWFSKLKNANPFPLPEHLPDDALELAKIAIRRMSLDLQAQISIFSTAKIENCIDKTWIVSSQSPAQKDLLDNLQENKTVYVYGPFRVWLRSVSISYFVLRGPPYKSNLTTYEDDDDPFDVHNLPLKVYGGKSKSEALKDSYKIHQQQEGDVLALCATGTSSRDSVLSWIRILETLNPNLCKLQCIFTLKAPVYDVSVINQSIDDDESNAERCSKL
ncbi:intermediate in Toll signal transduction pathway-like protein [Dinothrombium tinctorium]|uniref:Evolutionarily conserved signaling intermediate in Toll pathway, mitochondrial n=1 Tax=Dinothrombium tinctorium TaxID=1965070 RepID=A0A443QXB2_9ACAR|nr:intermediate in Toll signal transduction pathway-like protein [Dinothrombium tinctorium]